MANSNKKQLATDSLFGFQVICAIAYGTFQFVHMFRSTQGVSASMFLFAAIFVSVTTYLAFAAHRAQPSRITVQTMWIYLIGIVIYGSLFGLVIVRGQGAWDARDNFTSVVVFVGCAATLGMARTRNLTITDPVVKGVLALFCKAVPQFVMAYKIFRVGGGGLSFIAIVLFHVLTLTRIYQILMSIREAGWDRNRRGLVVSEIGNELSWVFVTIAWIIK